jgi:hypothetical protein
VNIGGIFVSQVSSKTDKVKECLDQMELSPDLTAKVESAIAFTERDDTIFGKPDVRFLQTELTTDSLSKCF